jgi:site-specific recombinase XerD
MAEPQDPLGETADHRTLPSAPLDRAPDASSVPSAARAPASSLLKHFRSTAIDDAGVLEDRESERARLRRGRPPKAAARTVFDNRPITSAEMAFLRATVQGVSPHRAALTYLPGDVHQDGRAARPYLRQLLDRLHDAAERVQTFDAQQRRAVLAELRALRREAADPPRKPRVKPGAAAARTPTDEIARAAPAPPAPASLARAARPKPPTLDEFRLQHDPDEALSERDLIRDYEEAYAWAGASGEVAAPQADAAAQFSLAPAPLQREVVASPPALASEVDATAPRKVRHVLDANSRLAMVDALAQLVAIEPTPNGELTIWLGEKLAAALRAHGLTTLSQVAIFINANGTTWHEPVKGLGPARAARLAVWLDEHSQQTGLKIRRRIMAVLEPRARGDDGATPPATAPHVRAAGALATTDGAERALRFGIVPLDDLDWPTQLLGVDSEFRGHETNAYGAHDDREALNAWVAKAVANKALATQQVVHRAIERLALWALVERGKALSALGTEDLLAFREFLYAPPAHWCGDDRVLRGSEDWRPLRGPMNAAAVRQVMVFVRQMYTDWYMSGYLRLNPAHGLSHHRARTQEQREHDKQAALAAAKAMTMNVRRSFVREDLDAMQRELQAMQERAFEQLLKFGPPRRQDLERERPTVTRLRAILSLYIDSGLRRSEVEMLTFGTPVPVRLNNELSGWLQITVLGKGDKPRDIPLRRRSLDLLDAHYADRMQLVEKDRLPKGYAAIPYEKTPVLSILSDTLRKPGKRGRGMTPADAPRRENKDGRLSSSSIAEILKDFFKRVGARTDLVTGQADFAAASTHWLRHTFAHRVIADTDAKLATVQKLLGHASLATTGLYLDADMSERVRAVAQLREVF